MRTSLSRRELILSASGVLVSAAVLGAVSIRSAEAQSPSSISQPPRWRGFPRQDAKLVREVVGVAHTDEQKVRDLIDATPALVNAWWDWGFGDWESPLGAAAHTGRRSIAELLLERGARIDIFAAAMLGMTDVVKALVTARPASSERLARTGFRSWRTREPEAMRRPKRWRIWRLSTTRAQALQRRRWPTSARPAYVGEYAVADASDARVHVTQSESGQLSIVLDDETGYTISRRIHHLGDDEFFPAGVPSVRVRFAMAGGKASALTIIDGGPVLVANRV